MAKVSNQVKIKANGLSFSSVNVDQLTIQGYSEPSKNVSCHGEILNYEESIIYYYRLFQT